MAEQRVILRRGVEGIILSIFSFSVIWGLCGFLFYFFFAIEKDIFALIPAIVFSCFGLYFFISFIETLCCPKIIITASQGGLLIINKFYRFDEIVSVSSYNWWNKYGQYSCGYLIVKTKDKKYIFGIVSKVYEAKCEINKCIGKD